MTALLSSPAAAESPSGDDLVRLLVDDLAAEMLARDPAYLARHRIVVPPAHERSARIAARGHDPAPLEAAVEAGLRRLLDLGLPIDEGDGDPVGWTLAEGLADAALAGLGLLDLRPEPRDDRSVEQMLAEGFEGCRLASGQRALIARRPGRPTVIVGALGVPVSLWRPLLADRTGPVRPILVETRCGGLLEGGMASDAPLTAHADDILEALERLAIGEADVIGWCNGGRIAVDVARRGGPRIGAVVLLCATLRGRLPATARPCPYEENLEKAFAHVRSKPAYAPHLARMMGQLFDAVDWNVIPDLESRAATFLSRPRATAATALASPMAQGDRLLAYAARTAADEAYPIDEALRELRQPLLVVTGERDEIVANPHTIETAGHAGAVPAVTVRGAGHFVPDLQYRYLRLVLERFAARPRTPDLAGVMRIGDARLADAPEWRYRPGAKGRDGMRYPLSRVYAHAAATGPERPAVADGEVALTFGALERGATALGRRLRRAGVAPGDHVLVLAEKRAVMPLVAGAIWKADAVYVPVDAASPAGRLATYLDQVRPSAIVGSRAVLDGLPAGSPARDLPRISFEEALAIDAEEAFATHDGEPEPSSAPAAGSEDRPAYVIFTSGSTGTPKGVVISHRSLLDYFYNHNQVLRFGPGSRVLSLAPFHFDVSIEDTILPLSLGAFVHQARGLPVGPVMRRVLRRERITHLIAVSSLLALITGDGAEIDAEKLPHLRMVMTGAEICDPRLIDLWVTRLPDARVINAYGPTEATIVCLTHTIEAPEPGRTEPYPIGKPLPGVRAIILDEEGREVSEPEREGELLIGGSQVMTGYLGRPEDTARACPVIEGVRYYRTGDVCRRDAQGRIVFAGRNDDMVKIAGRRIHLGEIRNLALGLPGVVRAAVGLLAVNDRPAIGLVLVLAEGAAPHGARAALADALPAAMMPAAIGSVREVRLTASGKTDERALVAALAAAVARRGPFDGPLDIDPDASPDGSSPDEAGAGVVDRASSIPTQPERITS